jgi:branched-chain amino acid transport system ATP-binding protein
MLRCDDLSYSYGAIGALRDVSLRVDPGQAVCVIGPNGAGKTTLARVLGGVLRPSSGTVSVLREPLSRDSHHVVTQGVASVLEGRHLFVEQDVRTNLELGGYSSRCSAKELGERIEEVYELFPALRVRRDQITGSLSGGEQQMVAVGRALISKPSVLILDEPSMGLSPKVASDVFRALAQLRDQGLAILLVEQNATLAFELTSYVYLLQQGRVVHEGSVAQMRQTEIVQQVYLGGV